MPPDQGRDYCADILSALRDIERFIAGRSFLEYQRDLMLQAAVERQFIIIGEAVSQLARLDPELAESLTDARDIIDFRNLLVHAYWDIDQRIIWNIIHQKSPLLRQEVLQLRGS